MRLRTLAFAALFLGSSTLLVSSTSEPPRRASVFFTMMSGAEEVPAVETNARGITIAVSTPAGRSLRYVMATVGLEDAIQAHIHLGPRGENGPVVAFLFGPEDPPVTRNGLLAMGSITADDLLGPLAGSPLSALLDAIRAGNTYVNVHTVANPSGEIRGQLHHPGLRRRRVR